MTTTVYTSESGADQAWTSVASRSGQTMRITGGTTTWTATMPLRPGRPHRLRASLNVTGPDSATTATVTIQGTTHTITTGRWADVEAPIDTTLPVTLTVSPALTVHARLAITTTDDVPTTPEPWGVLALDVLAPAPGATTLQWSRGRWNRGTWSSTQLAAGSLVWGTGKWNAGTWPATTSTTRWTSIIGPCTRLATTLGTEAAGPVLTAAAGTLAVEATDDLDPRALGLAWGTPIRLYHWPTATPIWTGWISDLATTPTKPGITQGTTTITATDAVARLVATPRYGARPDEGSTETWTSRATRLMRSAPADITWEATTSVTTPVCPTVWETSLASHLDALTATTGGAWTTTRTGAVSILATLPTTFPQYVLTDEPGEEYTTPVIHYTEGPTAWVASTVIAAVEATSHDATIDPTTGEWAAHDVKATATDPTRTTAWGGTTATVDVLTPTNGSQTYEAAARLLRRATEAPVMTSATWWPVSERTTATTQGPAMLQASTLDPLTPVFTSSRGEWGTCLITRISHDITPLTWRTHVELTPRG